MSSTLTSPVLKLDDHTLLERLLSQIREFPARPGEDDMTTVRRWLLTTETGTALTDYIGEEAGRLAWIAERLERTTTPDQQELAAELRAAADRLSTLTGVPSTLLR